MIAGEPAKQCSIFPQWSVRFSPTTTKAHVLGQGTAYYWDAQREKERSYRKARTRLVAKRRPGKDECQLCLQCPSQIPPSFPSSSPSILSLPLLPSSWAVFTPAEKDFSDRQTETSVCALTKNSLSMNSHLLSPLILPSLLLLLILQLFSLPPCLYSVYG